MIPHIILPLDKRTVRVIYKAKKIMKNRGKIKAKVIIG